MPGEIRGTGRHTRSAARAVWGDREVGSNNLEVFINFLRRKVDGPGHRKLIQTERGVGYSLRDEP